MVDCGHPLPFLSVSRNLPQSAGTPTRGDNKYPVPCAGDAKRWPAPPPSPPPESHLKPGGKQQQKTKKRKSEKAKKHTTAPLLLAVYFLSRADSRMHAMQCMHARQCRCLQRSQFNAAAVAEPTRTHRNSCEDPIKKTNNLAGGWNASWLKQLLAAMRPDYNASWLKWLLVEKASSMERLLTGTPAR